MRKAKLSLLPSEYFKRQIYATTWFEHRNLDSLIDSVGEDNIMFETDFPHPTCLYPDPLKTAEGNMRDLSPSVRRKILGENGIKLYRSESVGCDQLDARASWVRSAAPLRVSSPAHRVAADRRPGWAPR